MVEERIAYGIEKFLEEDFFLPENDSYCLEEKSDLSTHTPYLTSLSATTCW